MGDNVIGGILLREAVWSRTYVPALARAAMDQTEKRLVDALEIRRGTETKLTSLFGVFVSVSLAIFGLAAAIAQRSAPGWAVVTLGLSGLLFLCAAGTIGLGLRPAEGALLGGTPDFWLGRDAYHDAAEQDDEAQAARHFALAALDFADRIALQTRDNARLQATLRRAMALGCVGAVWFACVMLVFIALAR